MSWTFMTIRYARIWKDFIVSLRLYHMCVIINPYLVRLTDPPQDTYINVFDNNFVMVSFY